MSLPFSAALSSSSPFLSASFLWWPHTIREDFFSLLLLMVITLSCFIFFLVFLAFPWFLSFSNPASLTFPHLSLSFISSHVLSLSCSLSTLFHHCCYILPCLKVLELLFLINIANPFSCSLLSVSSNMNHSSPLLPLNQVIFWINILILWIMLLTSFSYGMHAFNSSSPTADHLSHHRCHWFLTFFTVAHVEIHNCLITHIELHSWNHKN